MNVPTLPLANGDLMPALGLGTWKSKPGEVRAAVAEALRIGYRHFDCAPIYGNEKEVGEALAEAIGSGRVSRGELWITSKLWNSNHLPDDVRPALGRTLADLQLEYLDLYLIHWPVALRPGVELPASADDFLAPEAAPLEDTWAAMEQTVDEGLCRHIGVSNFSLPRMQNLVRGARRPPAANQVECHPLLAQPELLEACREQNIILTAYAPLGSADRPARLQKSGDPTLLKNALIGSIARKHGISPAQVLLAWALTRGTAVIPKSINPGRMAENFAAAAVTLHREDMDQLATLNQNHRLLDGSLWAMPGSPYTLEWLWQEA